ncbi:hypothetical protein DPMN_169638 [Dreissena polymorpha]|uniref:Uncharacterized protein n=1 Tax=Dreissena polymorpha TaxID=45954 RepID=A0A9D4IAU0_DREPO|nr:hypothetical protein DPMN_169638 [Dreissena polymorpha]
MPRIIISRLKSKTKKLLVAEQTGFRAWLSTVEHIFDCQYWARHQALLTVQERASEDVLGREVAVRAVRIMLG